MIAVKRLFDPQRVMAPRLRTTAPGVLTVKILLSKQWLLILICVSMTIAIVVCSQRC